MIRKISSPFYILYFGIIALLPLSFSFLEYKDILVFFLLAFLHIFLLQKKIKPEIAETSVSIFGDIIFTVLMLFLFDTIEKINIVQQFSMSVDIKKRIPVSTIILVIAIIVLVVRNVRKDKIEIILPQFFKLYIIVSTVAVAFMFGLLLIIRSIYSTSFDIWFSLLNNLFRYMFLILILNYSVPKQNNSKILNVIILASLCLTVILKFIYT